MMMLQPWQQKLFTQEAREQLERAYDDAALQLAKLTRWGMVAEARRLDRAMGAYRFDAVKLDEAARSAKTAIADAGLY